MSTRSAEAPRLGMPVVASAIVHGAVVLAAVIASRREPPPPLPPVYRVNIVAAPPGPRQAGIVRPPQARTPAPPTPAPEPAPPTPPRARETPVPQTMPAPTPAPPQRQAPRATPNPTPTPPTPAQAPAAPAPERPRAADPEPAPRTPPRPSPGPTAGGGPTGGRGTDVATVDLRGIEFPFPGYLNNIVRQIALRFQPESPGQPLSAEVVFTILRDGSVREVRFLKRSGDYEFDSEARGAVEAAARAKAFGALPDGFRDDALTVYFSFDPRIIR